MHDRLGKYFIQCCRVRTSINFTSHSSSTSWTRTFDNSDVRITYEPTRDNQKDI